MSEQELRRWAIEQAIAYGHGGDPTRIVARDFVDFVKQNDDAAVAHAARQLADKVKPDGDD